MAENFTRVQRWDNGVLVEDYTVPKPLTQYNAETLRERAATALTNNADFLALASPTQAQAVAQIKALTRQVNGLIRLGLDRLDSIDDA